MGFFSGAKKVVKPLVDVPAWTGASDLKSYAEMIKGLVVNLFVAQRPNRPAETFEEAMERQGLTEADIAKRKHECFRLCIIFAVVSFLFVAYFVYLILGHGTFKECLLVFGLTFIPLAHLFRYHFWWFQMNQRMLGCSLSTWFFEGLLRMKP